MFQDDEYSPDLFRQVYMKNEEDERKEKKKEKTLVSSSKALVLI